MTYYGGFVAGSIAGTVFVKLAKMPVSKLADVCFPIGLIGLGIGRIGCFLNGDDYGIAVSLTADGPWWSVTFPYHHHQVARLPIQLIESGTCFIAGLVAMKWQPVGQEPGFVALSCIGFYAVFRFFAEYGRGDERGWWIEGLLSTSQGISVIIVGVLVMVSVFRLRRTMQNVKA